MLARVGLPFLCSRQMEIQWKVIKVEKGLTGWRGHCLQSLNLDMVSRQASPNYNRLIYRSIRSLVHFYFRFFFFFYNQSGNFCWTWLGFFSGWIWNGGCSLIMLLPDIMLSCDCKLYYYHWFRAYNRTRWCGSEELFTAIDGACEPGCQIHCCVLQR